MSDEAKCHECGADMTERYSEHGDLVERRCSDGVWLCRTTARALEAERAKTSELRHLLARALTRLKGGHEPGITNDIEEALR